MISRQKETKETKETTHSNVNNLYGILCNLQPATQYIIDRRNHSQNLLLSPYTTVPK